MDINEHSKKSEPNDVHQPEMQEPVTTRVPTPEGKIETSPYPVIERSLKGEHKLGRYALIGAGAAALVGVSVSAGIIASAFLNRSNNAGPAEIKNKDRQTVATKAVAEPSPSPTPSVTESGAPNPLPSESESVSPEGIVSVPEIPASLTPEQIGVRAFKEVFVDWRNGGITPDLVSKQQQSGRSISEYAAVNSQAQATGYENALYIDGWQGRQDLLTYTQQIQAMNEENIVLAIDTAHDTYPFKWGVTSEQVAVTDSSGSEVDVTVTYRDYENATQNSAMNVDPTLIQNVIKNERLDIRLLQVGDSMKISAITKIDLPTTN